MLFSCWNGKHKYPFGHEQYMLSFLFQGGGGEVFGNTVCLLKINCILRIKAAAAILEVISSGNLKFLFFGTLKF